MFPAPLDCRRIGEHRQPHDELAPSIGALAVGLDAAAVQLNQLPDQRQTDPQPAQRSIEIPIALGEHFENMRQHFGRDAHSGVRHRSEPHLLGPWRSANRAASLGVLGGVVEEIRQHLRQPSHVAAEHRGLRRQLDRKFVAALLDERPAGFDLALRHGRQLDGPFEAQLARGDPRDVEQVVDQPRHLTSLAIDHILAHSNSGVFNPLRCRMCRALPIGTSGLQLMGKGRQEFVLVAGGFSKSHFGGFEIGIRLHQIGGSVGHPFFQLACQPVQFFLGPLALGNFANGTMFAMHRPARAMQFGEHRDFGLENRRTDRFVQEVDRAVP